MKRSRGRGRRQQNPVNRSYDSNGPDVRVRGTANQVYEKYQALTRDAMSSGDRVMAENYQQHGEHYYRIMLAHQPTPSEADKEASLANGNALADVRSGGDDKAGNEPLVLVRENGLEADEARPAKPSRRRGPLRKKKTGAAQTGDAGVAENNAPDGAPENTPENTHEAAPVIAETVTEAVDESGDSEAANPD